ncbi:MAG TPA: hypothetical protein G4O08_08800 [Anaerolineae bacterium]|nr:hypothetical protein [Anaerolineae bacterium]
MKRFRPISFALMTMFVLMLACGPMGTAEPTIPPEDAAATAVELTQTAHAAAMETLAPDTETPSPTATQTAVPTSTNTPIPSPTPFCDRAAFISESIPDGMDFEPDTAFTKSWRLQNAGACTWTSEYSLVFDHGDLMSAPTIVPLSGSVAPGQEVDVEVDMVAPSSEGSYTGHWMLRNNSGVLFGLGSNANLTFWVEIDVVEPPPIVMIIPGIIQPLFPGWLLPRTEQEYGQTSLSAGSSGHAEVSCPSGSIVVGGGFGATNGLVVYSSVPISNGWRVYAKNTTTINKQFNAYAICLYNTAGTVSFESNNEIIPAGGANSSKAVCPSGSYITGGGFASNPNRHWVYATLKSGTGWETYARNITTADHQITTYAVCLSGVNASTTQVFDQSTIPGTSSGGGEVACPTNTLTTGGGFWLSTNMQLYSSFMKLTDSSRWNNFARNNSFTPRLINIYATCLSFP